MSGVEILYSNIIYNTLIPESVAIIAAALAVIGFVMALCFASSQKLTPCIISTVLCIGFIALALFSLVPNKNSIDYVEYKVIISDEVSMNEFLDKYEIIDQEGKIYTVRERTDD